MCLQPPLAISNMWVLVLAVPATFHRRIQSLRGFGVLEEAKESGFKLLSYLGMPFSQALGRVSC